MDRATTAVRPEIADFFADFATGTRALATEGFAETFLSLDPAFAAVVKRGDLAKALPRRKEMFGAAGATGMELAELAEQRLDETHTLVETSWLVRFSDAEAEPLSLTSAYLLRREPTGWRIVVYLNHHDVAAELVAHTARRVAAAVEQGSATADTG